MDNPIINSTHEELFLKRMNYLKNMLEKALHEPFLNFSQISLIDEMGLYLIYDDAELLYIGMTTRDGCVRLGEMCSGYRSHTFNRKLLAQHFRGLGHEMHVVNPKTFHKLWIETEIISKSDLKEAQRAVNNKIRQRLRFRFYKTRDIQLEHLELFAIATLQPLYNF